MAKKDQKQENKNLKNWIIVGWIFFVAILIGRAAGILLTHDDVANVGDFFNRLGTWDFFWVLVFILLIGGSIKGFSKN